MLQMLQMNKNKQWLHPSSVVYLGSLFMPIRAHYGVVPYPLSPCFMPIRADYGVVPYSLSPFSPLYRPPLYHTLPNSEKGQVRSGSKLQHDTSLD
jgi:hypothetical protein